MRKALPTLNTTAIAVMKIAATVIAAMVIAAIAIVAALSLVACVEDIGINPGTISITTSNLTIEDNTAYCMGDCMAYQPDCMIELTATLQQKNSKGKWVDYYQWFKRDNGMVGATVSTSKNDLPVGQYRLVVTAKAYDGKTLLDTSKVISIIGSVESD